MKKLLFITFLLIMTVFVNAQRAKNRSASIAFKELIPYCDKGSWGFYTENGYLLIDCKYESADFFSADGLAKVKQGGKYGYINKQGVVIIPIVYDRCDRIYEVHRKAYSSEIKYDSMIHLNQIFQYEGSEENRYIVSSKNNFGVLFLKSGKPKTLIAFEYSRIQFDPLYKIFHCTKKGQIQYFDFNGRELTKDETKDRFLPPTIIADESFDDNNKYLNKKIQVISSKRKFGVMSNNDTILPLVYDEIVPDKYFNSNADDEIFGVRIGNKWGVVDDKNVILLPIEYDSIQFKLSFNKNEWAEYNRYFVLKKNDNWGIIGIKNQDINSVTTLLPFEYESISEIYYSYFRVQNENKYTVYSTFTHKLINNKFYTTLEKYEYESSGEFMLFQTKNKSGETVFIGENGIEFFKD